MAENVLVLKKKAVAAGMPKAEAMKASRSTLEDFLSSSNGKKKGTSKKKKGTTRTTTTAVKKKKRNTTTTKPAAKKTRTRRAPAKGDGDGRHMIGSLDFTNTEDWNPRADSPVAAIFKALKKRKGDVDKTTDDLLPNAKDYVSTSKADGTRRTKAEIRNLLRYRVNRTKWEFARRTGQHEPSQERVEYGTGEYAQNSKKAKRAAARKSTTKKSTTRKKPGRKKSRK